jgi:hypothetical protein
MRYRKVSTPARLRLVWRVQSIISNILQSCCLKGSGIKAHKIIMGCRSACRERYAAWAQKEVDDEGIVSNPKVNEPVRESQSFKFWSEFCRILNSVGNYCQSDQNNVLMFCFCLFLPDKNL